MRTIYKKLKVLHCDSSSFFISRGQGVELPATRLFLPLTSIKPLMILLFTHLARHFLQPPTLALESYTLKLCENPAVHRLEGGIILLHYVFRLGIEDLSDLDTSSSSDSEDSAVPGPSSVASALPDVTPSSSLVQTHAHTAGGESDSGVESSAKVYDQVKMEEQTHNSEAIHLCLKLRL